MKQPKVRAQRHLDIVDMPTDPYNVTGNLRQELVKQVNYSRTYPAKVAVLKEVLEYTLSRIDQIVEDDAAEQAKRAEVREAKAEAKKQADQDASEKAEAARLEEAKALVAAAEKAAETAQETATPAPEPAPKPAPKATPAQDKVKETKVAGAKVANNQVR